MKMESIIGILSVLVAVATFLIAHFVSRSRDRVVANREIYQQLELASLDLFRFEADHLEVIRPLWQKDADTPPEGSAEHMAFTNYVCQNLNLFEMCMRFRREGVVQREVFGTWVMWFYNLSQAPGFAPIWSQVRLEYSRDLRGTLDTGAALAKSDTDEDAKQRAFFSHVADLVDCDLVRSWLGDGPSSKESVA